MVLAPLVSYVGVVTTQKLKQLQKLLLPCFSIHIFHAQAIGHSVLLQTRSLQGGKKFDQKLDLDWIQFLDVDTFTRC